MGLISHFLAHRNTLFSGINSLLVFSLYLFAVRKQTFTFREKLRGKTTTFSLSFSTGIASLIRLLSSAGEESQPGLTVLLCEILTAVFLSLFVHGMATHSSNELFRIVAHPLSSKLWVTVFGGGARTPVMEKSKSPTRTPSPG